MRNEDDLRKLQSLKVGDGMPFCKDCKVIETAMTREECAQEVHSELSALLGTDTRSWVTEETTFGTFDFNQAQLRRFWNRFFVAADVGLILDEEGDVIGYVAEEDELPPIPSTVGQFIDEVYECHKVPRHKACTAHL